MSEQNKKEEPTPSFEQSLDRLEHLVEELEKGELSLEDALTRFESGVRLARHCHQSLAQARQKIEILQQELPGENPSSSDN